MRTIRPLFALMAVCLGGLLPVHAQTGDKGVWVRQPPVFIRKGTPDRTLSEGSYEFRYTAKDEKGQEQEYYNKITFEAPPERMIEGETYTLEIDSTANPGAELFGSWMLEPGSLDTPKGRPTVVSNPKHMLDKDPHHGEYTFRWIGARSRALNVPQPEVPVKVYFIGNSRTEQSWQIRWNYKLDPTAKTPTLENLFTGARPLDVRINLDSYRQTAGIQSFVRGDVTVQAPVGVKPGWQVMVTVFCIVDTSYEDALKLFHPLKRVKPEQRHALLFKHGAAIKMGFQTRTKTLTLDAQRRAVASLETDFKLPLPSVPPGSTERQCAVGAIATLGPSYYGETQVGMEVSSVRKGTRFVSLATMPDPAVGGREMTLALTCEVNGLASGIRTVPTNAEGRLLWLGAPKDKWIDGRRNDGTSFKAPPMIPLPAQRVSAEALDSDPTRAGVRFTWTVQLPGPGTYVAALDVSPVGFDFLQREVTFEAVEAPAETSLANPNQGRPESPQPGESQQTPTSETPADAPAGTTNLAFRKPAAQCCDVEHRLAHFAVDGVKLNTNEFRAGVACNKPGAPYWVVDLGQVADITEVRLYNWIAHEHLAAYAKWIEVWFSTTPTDAHPVYAREENDTWGMDGKPLIINLKRIPPGRRQARYVMLKNPGPPALDINLVEVEVYGRYIGQAPAPSQPPAGEGPRREGGGQSTGQVITFGPLKLQLREGKVVLPGEATVEGAHQLPSGAQLVSIGGQAVSATTVEALNTLLKPLRGGVAVMRFRLPEGSEMVVTVLDE